MTEEKTLKQILEEIFKSERSLIITLPSKIQWNDYEKELRKAANYKYVLNFISIILHVMNKRYIKS